MASQGDIEAATGVTYSTIIGILRLRIYLGEVQTNGGWFPGHHEALITPELLSAATRGRRRLTEVVLSDDVARHFDDVAQMLAALERTWAVATTKVERRVPLDEFSSTSRLPDYIDVNIHGAPPIHVLYQEVGLNEGVGV